MASSLNQYRAARETVRNTLKRFHDDKDKPDFGATKDTEVNSKTWQKLKLMKPTPNQKEPTLQQEQHLNLEELAVLRKRIHENLSKKADK